MTDQQVAAVIDSCSAQLKELGAGAFIIAVRTNEGAFSHAEGRPDFIIYLAEVIKKRILEDAEAVEDDFGAHVEEMV